MLVRFKWAIKIRNCPKSSTTKPFRSLLTCAVAIGRIEIFIEFFFEEHEVVTQILINGLQKVQQAVN